MDRISGSFEKVQGIEGITTEQINSMLEDLSRVNSQNIDPVVKKTTEILAYLIYERRSKGEEVLDSNNTSKETCYYTAERCLAAYMLQYQPTPIRVVYVGPPNPIEEGIWETILNGMPIRDTAMEFADKVLKHFQKSFTISDKIESAIVSYVLSPVLN